MKRATQLEIHDMLAIREGVTLDKFRAERMVKRGLAEWYDGKLRVTEEGRLAFVRWSGVPLP